jgi:hypothetical protein
MALRTKTIAGGGWRTLESFWNSSATGFFLRPEGAKIRVRYGGWWTSWNRQNQTLNGETIKKLSVGTGSLITARMQMYVAATSTVTYDIEPGSLSALPPGISF